MSTSSGLLNSSNAPSSGSFGNSDIAKLKKTGYSSDLGMSLSDFIEAMHITQVSSSMREYTGLSDLVNAVRNGGTNQPVIICVRGPGGGHAILGYGVTDSGSVKVYDSNWPGQERIVKINGSSWSYELWRGLTWGSNNGKISYIPYNVYSAVWNSRGALNSAGLMEGRLFEEENGNYLLTTSADDFTLLNFDGDLMARYEDGVLTEQSESVKEVFLDSALLYDEDPAPVHMLYVPEDLYTVTNQTGGNVDMSLSGLDLSVRVNTEAGSFDLAVSDGEGYANAILSAAEGEAYSISVGSSREGDPDETTIEGTGNGQTISLGMSQDGLYISNGTDEGMLSLGELEQGASSGKLVQDFTLNSSDYEMEYPVTASSGTGGSVYPDGVTMVRENGTQTYRILPSEGFTLRAVYVNGVEAVYGAGEGNVPAYSYFNGAYEYTFRDVKETGSIYVEFAREIGSCDISVENVNGQPSVTVVDSSREGDAAVLSENTDYLWSLRNDPEDGETYVIVQAVAGSMYSVVYQTPYTYHEGGNRTPVITDAAYDPDLHQLHALVSGAEEFHLLAGVYSRQADGRTGAMLAYLPSQSWQQGDPEENGVPVFASLNNLSLPENFIIKLFLMDGNNSLYPIAAPVSLSSTAGK